MEGLTKSFHLLLSNSHWTLVCVQRGALLRTTTFWIFPASFHISINADVMSPLQPVVILVTYIISFYCLVILQERRSNLFIAVVSIFCQWFHLQIASWIANGLSMIMGFESSSSLRPILFPYESIVCRHSCMHAQARPLLLSVCVSVEALWV